MHFEDMLAQKEFNDMQPVKKNLWLAPNFTVALICLKAGMQIPPHPEPFAVYFQVLEGRGVFSAGSESVELGPGGAITIEPNEMRGLQCVEDIVVLGVHDPH